MSATGRPTLADVAARAGVSLKTASRALNAEYGVAPTTAERVRNAARELGFRPNQLARSLAGGRPSAAVGLLIPDVADPFVAALVGAVEQVLAPHDLQPIGVSHGNDPARQHRLATALIERRVDALLVMSAPGSVAWLAPEMEHGLAVVAIDRPLEGVEVDTVTVDNEGGGRALTEELLAAGHRRIAILAGDIRLWTLIRRLDGYHAALAAAGIAADPALICTDPDPALAEAALCRMLALADPPTAVVAAQHIAGHAAMRAIHAAGTDTDLAVFDGMDDPDLLAIRPLAVALSGPDRIGRIAAQLAVERLGGLQARPRHVILPPELGVTDARHAAGRLLREAVA